MRLSNRTNVAFAIEFGEAFVGDSDYIALAYYSHLLYGGLKYNSLLDFGRRHHSQRAAGGEMLVCIGY